jgi:hypothetical protein
MATRRQAQCINKTNRSSSYDRISHIGGVNSLGTRWKLTQDEAIQGIENGDYSFYVSKAGHTVDVIVSKSAFGNKYIKTVNDGEIPDNLLSLPECP